MHNRFLERENLFFKKRKEVLYQLLELKTTRREDVGLCAVNSRSYFPYLLKGLKCHPVTTEWSRACNFTRKQPNKGGFMFSRISGGGKLDHKSMS